MASPRTSAPPTESDVREPKEGLSAQTLIIAAVSSGVAAVVVSNLWERGTIIASAMTPVVVAIISELMKKPVESERLRSGVRNVSSVSRPRSGRTPKVMSPPPAGVDEGLQRRDNGREAGPVRVYSSGTNRRPRPPGASRRRRFNPRIAILTGLIAFLIAAAALTLPELIFGGSIGGGDRGTTYFGGGSDSQRRGESQDGEPRDGQPDAPTGQPDSEAPVAPGGEPPADEEEAPAPQPTPPTPTTPPEAPTQPPPESGGTTAP